MTDNNKQLIDDSGMHSNTQEIASKRFVLICRFFCIVLAILGIAALYNGFM